METMSGVRDKRLKKPAGMNPKDCTVYKTVDFISKRWTLLVILEIYKAGGGPLRYSEIKRKIPGITAKLLSARLRELEAEGILVNRIDKTVIPVRSDYTLTDGGRAFYNVISAVKAWALEWKHENAVCKDTECMDCVL